jgi:hypothetical protein
MKLSDFEDKVWELEGIRLVVRAPSSTKVDDYSYKSAADKSWSVTEFLKKRVLPKLSSGDDTTHEVSVIEGNGEEPNGKTKLRTLRASYGTE